jgi:predicted nucleotidyltransferase
LFGSYAKDIPTEASDIDLVVEFERPLGFKFIELSEYLERLLGQEVDVLTLAGIQGIRIDHIAQSIDETSYMSERSDQDLLSDMKEAAQLLRRQS